MKVYKPTNKDGRRVCKDGDIYVLQVKLSYRRFTTIHETSDKTEANEFYNGSKSQQESPMPTTHTNDIKIEVSEPTVPKPNSMTKEDVWGKTVPIGLEEHAAFDGQKYTVSKVVFIGGMVIARGHGFTDVPAVKCPVFGDEIPRGSVTVVCPANKVEEVQYWLEYVQGADCVSKVKPLMGHVALRSDYKCW